MPAKPEPTIEELNARIEKLSAEKRRRGRPSHPRKYGIPKHMFMDRSTLECLEQLAVARGCSQSAVVRSLIRKAFDEQLKQKGETHHDTDHH